MILIEENGVKVQFPDKNYFQFSICPAYNNISGKGVKETDVCWFDSNANTLWLVELKSFDNPSNPKYLQQDLSNSSRVEYWLTELKDKSIHSVSMVLTNRSNTQSCMTILPDNNTIINIVHLVKVMSGQEVFLNPMQDELRKNLKAYQAIFNVKSITIISYDFAISNKLLPWIV